MKDNSFFIFRVDINVIPGIFFEGSDFLFSGKELKEKWDIFHSPSNYAPSFLYHVFNLPFSIWISLRSLLLLGRCEFFCFCLLVFVSLKAVDISLHHVFSFLRLHVLMFRTSGRFNHLSWRAQYSRALMEEEEKY